MGNYCCSGDHQRIQDAGGTGTMTPMGHHKYISELDFRIHAQTGDLILFRSLDLISKM